jgi:resuscitation-promoting factor RpfA
MLRSPAPGSTRTTARAVAVTAIAVATTALTFRLRPAVPSADATPVADVVTGCAWLAWALVGYLAIAVGATSLGHVAAAVGLRGRVLARLAPAGVRRLVDVSITLSVAAAVLGTTAAVPAGAVARSSSTSGHAPGAIERGGLDWPGLSMPTQPAAHFTVTAPPPRKGPTARVGLVTGARTAAATGRDPVVVRAGDSLWKIAARHLGAGATAQATAVAWQQWYVANRDVVGDDPDRIFPGQRLRPPQRSGHSAAVPPTGSTR